MSFLMMNQRLSRKDTEEDPTVQLIFQLENQRFHQTRRQYQQIKPDLERL